ncbi:hypothetical protein BDW22DRAFT_1427335 [Trametopsis cervina]|nr:hypothetical protein BDW22DRAFT_1427335 [Trametopsis cervina]
MIPTTVLFVSAAVFSAFTSVAAHGFLASVTIEGKNYPAWDAFVDPYASPVPSRVTRKVQDDGPVLDIHSADLACNVGGQQGAGIVAQASAGSSVTITMNRWPDDHLGPELFYMAACDGNNCKTSGTGDLKWFKVQADGLDNGVWASTKLIQNGLSSSMTIPQELKPGQYLIRHELIALHDADQPQFYPECIQVEVTGSGTTTPPASELVSIPGVYNNYKFPDIWQDGFNSFTVPGPAAAFSGAGSSTGGTNNNAPQPPSQKPEPPSSPSVSPSVSIPTSSPSASHAPPSTKTSSGSSLPTGQCRGGRKFKRHAALGAKRHH